VSDARVLVSELLVRAGVPAPIGDNVRLAVSEAVSNAIVHGYRDSPVGEVTLEAEAAGSRVRVVVRDAGCGMSPRSDSPGAGFGLPLIAEMSETVSVTPGRGGRGTELCMTFGRGPTA
jgi:serine/threonine-protein kinase RsbW/stage II sporulation protein AB (anti-sigma F factor)